MMSVFLQEESFFLFEYWENKNKKYSKLLGLFWNEWSLEQVYSFLGKGHLLWSKGFKCWWIKEKQDILPLFSKKHLLSSQKSLTFSQVQYD